jgi:hypothetical protein
MKSTIPAVTLGLFIGCVVAFYWPAPFIVRFSDKPSEYLDISKQEFIARFIDTFDAGNPYSEDSDQHDYAARFKEVKYEISIKNYYEKFEQAIKIIAPGICSINKIVVESKYENDDAKSREFIVLDVENCKSTL